MHGLEMERFAMQRRAKNVPVSLKFPREYSSEIFVVTLRFTIGSLVFFPEMSATGFVALQRINAHELGKLEKISDPSRAFERLIVAFAFAGNPNAFPKLLA